MKAMLNCTDDELKTVEMFTALTVEKERDLDLELFRELRRGEREHLRQEKHFILKDGRSVWANVIFTLLRDPKGAPWYVISIHEDITERKLALEKLQERDELLDLAQKAARAMAFDWYIQSEVNTWSAEQEKLYGIVPGTFDGTFESWKKLIHPKDWPNVVKALKHAQETGVISAEYRVVWPDGSTHWLSANGQMFLDDAGQPYRMVGFTADVTQRKVVEEELRRSEAFLAEGQRLSLTGTFLWHPDNDEVVFSDEARRIFGFEPDKAVTLALIGSRVHPEDVAVMNEKIANARDLGIDQDFENRLLIPDGSVKYIHTIARCVQNEDGGLEYIGAIQDITERRLAEEELSHARAELAHVARVTSLGALTASIAHEVSQPLSGIITNASTCLRMLSADPPNVEGALETVRRTLRDGNRASDVIMRLRALFSKKQSIAELVDLNQATRDVIALSMAELQRRSVILRTKLAEDVPPVTGDRVQLQQVILNLVLNASDAMSEIDDRPRHLTIKTERYEPEGVCVTVQDAGVGIEPQGTDKLFEPFYTTKSKGMGIGLFVSRSIIEKHKGRLWASSNDGHGATFSFTIPRGPEAKIEPAHPAR
jgi:PAS domain S-box-containing protein